MLHEKYVVMSTADILEIVGRKGDYTDLAIAVARKELKRRKVSDEEIKDHKSINLEVDDSWLENGLFDLSLSQKFFFYCSAIIRLIAKKFHLKWPYNFRAEGYLLKSNQSNYYTVVGLVFICLSIAFSGYSFSYFLFLYISGFIASFLFDVLYNKERQTKKIEETIKDGKLPYGYFDL